MKQLMRRLFTGFVFSGFFIYICLLAGRTTIIIEPNHEVFKMDNPWLALVTFIIMWVAIYLELLNKNRQEKE